MVDAAIESNYGEARLHTDGVIVHSTRGNAESPEGELVNTLAWFETPRSKASANVVIHVNGEIYETVIPALVSWGAGRELNERYLNVELVQQTAETPFTNEQYTSLAWWVRQQGKRFGFSFLRMNIMGHDETAQGIEQGKTDPGPLFNWGRFMRLLWRQH